MSAAGDKTSRNVRNAAHPQPRDPTRGSRQNRHDRCSNPPADTDPVGHLDDKDRAQCADERRGDRTDKFPVDRAGENDNHRQGERYRERQRRCNDYRVDRVGAMRDEELRRAP